MFESKIRISKDLLERVKQAVEAAGYSSVDEFVNAAIERELDRIAAGSSAADEDQEAIRKKLQGLGYID